LEKPKATYPFREADILAYAGTMSTEKKNEKWKTILGEEIQNGARILFLTCSTDLDISIFFPKLTNEIPLAEPCTP
jgi:hypothetical protein